MVEAEVEELLVGEAAHLSGRRPAVDDGRHAGLPPPLPPVGRAGVGGGSAPQAVGQHLCSPPHQHLRAA